MAYTDEGVRAKLSALNETQESIVTVAQWIMFHRYVWSFSWLFLASALFTLLQSLPIHLVLEMLRLVQPFPWPL